MYDTHTIMVDYHLVKGEKMGKWKNILFIALTFAMLLYAIPQLSFDETWTASTIFSLLWILFSLVVIAAHLHQLLGVDEAEQERLDAIKRVRKWKMNQLMQGNKGFYATSRNEE